MYLIKIQGHNYEFDIREMIMQYFPQKSVVVNDQSHTSDYPIVGVITNGLQFIENNCIFITTIERDGHIVSKYEMQLPIPIFENLKEKKKWIKRQLKITIYKAMEKAFQRSLPWGILTGIRPTKIVHQLLDEGKNIHEIRDFLENQCLLKKDKASLLIEVALEERDIIYPINKNKVSLYIGIPFCPSRCIYCSFVSYVMDKERNILRQYLRALHYEIKEIGKFLRENNIAVQSIYIGGGTPTVLEPIEMDDLLTTIEKSINMNEVEEYTLEAGRPDTINKDKLLVAYKHGITRISINPQSMNQETLDRIGRNHTPDEIIKTYHLAKKIGFPCINMDLILGLPGEDIKMLERTIDRIQKLEPENITIHTMSIKKGSKLKEQMEDIDFTQEKIVNEMLKRTQEFAQCNGYIPYYLYRQKYMMGNHENVGYCKPNFKGIYNIEIMGEKQSIIGLGAGSTSKIVFLEENRIERVPNVKNVDQYIHRVEEMVDRKIGMLNKLY